MVINKLSQTDLSGFYVVYKGSCLLEDEGERGLSHLMEHLLCKTYDELLPEFDAYAVDWNAWTSQKDIVFFINGLDEHVNRFKYKIIDALKNFNITQEQLDNEISIVKSEYYMSFNDSTQGHFLNVWRKYYDFYNPIGAMEDLNNITLDKCYEFYGKQFKNPSEIINISKHSEFNANDMEFFNPDLTSKIYEFNDHSNFELEPFPVGENYDSLIMLSKPLPEDTAHTAHFVSRLLSHGLVSPLYREIREKHGLLYNLSLFSYALNNDTVPVFYAPIHRDNVPKTVDLMKEILSKPEQYISFDDFLKMKSLFKNQYKIMSINNHSNITEELSPEVKKLKDNLQSLTYEDCIDLINKAYQMDDWQMSIGNEMMDQSQI